MTLFFFCAHCLCTDVNTLLPWSGLGNSDQGFSVLLTSSCSTWWILLHFHQGCTHQKTHILPSLLSSASDFELKRRTHVQLWGWKPPHSCTCFVSGLRWQNESTRLTFVYQCGTIMIQPHTDTHTVQLPPDRRLLTKHFVYFTIICLFCCIFLYF